MNGPTMTAIVNEGFWHRLWRRFNEPSYNRVSISGTVQLLPVHEDRACVLLEVKSLLGISRVEAIFCGKLGRDVCRDLRAGDRIGVAGEFHQGAIYVYSWKNFTELAAVEETMGRRTAEQPPRRP